jgi:hypothetical protein
VTVTPSAIRLRLPDHALPVAGAATAAVAFGAVLGAGRWREATELLVLGSALAAGLRSWRRSVLWLLAYLPLSGIPIVATYPNTQLAVLAKDFLFVIPAYVGFVVTRVGHERRLGYEGAPTLPLLLVAMLVVGQAFNPNLANHLVALIGVKVWLFYVPLCFLGYHLVERRQDLDRLLGLLAVSAIIPAVVGLVEAGLIYSGRANTVYAWYGGAASAVTQHFTQFELEGGGTLRRVPGTFSFVAQYFSFTVCMVAVTHAWWRGSLARSRFRHVGAAVWLLLLFAGMLSGARGAFVFIPGVALLAAWLERPRLRLPLGKLVAAFGALAGVTVVLGASLGGLFSVVLELAAKHFQTVVVEGFRHGLSITLMGFGTGADTNAGRYAVSQAPAFSGVDGTWFESWYVKVLLELGAVGLVMVVVLLGTILNRAARQHAGVVDRRLKTISASLLAVLVWAIVYALKGQYLDMDPLNVYFWLFVGVLASIPRLEQADAREQADA